MNVITYRGPGMSGGLSSAVGQAWHEYAVLGDTWWHIGKNNLQFLVHGLDKAIEVKDMPVELVEGHYRYCNEFLWPILHDMEEYAVYHPADRQLYKQFNALISQSISSSLITTRDEAAYFIHDYHFALLPQLLRRQANARSVCFWHIPWPRAISRWSSISQLADIARGLLASQTIGFHTQEYVLNFMRFVEQNLPEYKCNWEKMSISQVQGRRPNVSVIERMIELVVLPIGIDYQVWQNLANDGKSALAQTFLPTPDKPYILSIDRADYTKGVGNRLSSIDHFFAEFPQWKEKINFVQICGRTRPGLDAFDQYWHDCHERRKDIENKFSTGNWNPIIWLDSSYCNADLAQLYKNAAVMLVSPIRDGLNLTAKEYIACQGNNPGVLALSDGAGAWHELGNYALTINPKEPQEMARALNKALLLSEGEKSMRMSLLSEIVQNNNLANWWYNLRNRLENKAEKRAGQKHLLSLPALLSSSR